MSVQLNSNDGHSFVVPKELCAISQHIQDTLDISDQYEELPTMDLIQINGIMLEIIVNFMREYHSNPFETLTRDTPYDSIPAYYRNLLETLKLIGTPNVDDVSLMSLMICGTSLQIEPLSSLIAYNMARLIKDKNLKQRFALFDIPEDHVVNQADVEKLREDYSYAFTNEQEQEQ